jgi:tetratricopeptide (TPR) repeat protein
MSDYPLCRGFYYGVNYGAREKNGAPPRERPTQFIPAWAGEEKVVDPIPPHAPNDLSWYANIPTPCSYMCLGSKSDFFGGYDYKAQAGLVHVADHHLAPGKKQWTWGNHPFGYAWDRNLTDADERGEFGPYIEVMAGVFTDNQPDFSFLQPGETRSLSQYLYPIQKIGPVQQANVDAAVSLALEARRFRIGVSVTRDFPQAVIKIQRTDGSGATECKADLAPGRPWLFDSPQPRKPWKMGETVLRVLDADKREIIAYRPTIRRETQAPSPATEPPSPRETTSADELYLTGLHLEQYRHATRCPTAYWLEALRRDPLDSRCSNAMGLWRLKRGEFQEAENHFRKAIQRLTAWNANPRDGEAYYNLGLCLRYQLDALPVHSSEAKSKFEAAYSSFYKAVWNQAWAPASYYALAELDCRRSDFEKADEHLAAGVQLDPQNGRALNLWGLVLRKLGDISADEVINMAKQRDPLDYWSRSLLGEPVSCDLQARLDIAHDFARAGFYQDALDFLADARSATRDLPDQNWGALPLVLYTTSWLQSRLANPHGAPVARMMAAAMTPDYCFPARLEEITILDCAIKADPRDARAPYYLGNLLYDRRRHLEAIRLWERSAELDPHYSVVWRNLGIGYFNVLKKFGQARLAYDQAIAANPEDARLLYERDQLGKRLGEIPRRRLQRLEKRLDLARSRDDLSVELCSLYTQTGQPTKALELLRGRKFQPWEGGEGQALGQHVRAQLALGKAALAAKSHATARAHFEEALKAPDNLGEAFHLLANQSDIYYWLGEALAALGETASSREWWQCAAAFQEDFQKINAQPFSEMTFYSALSLRKLGREPAARKLLQNLLVHARKLFKSPAKID